MTNCGNKDFTDAFKFIFQNWGSCDEIEFTSRVIC